MSLFSLTGRKAEPDSEPTAVTPVTLDQLWHEAAQLGGVRLWMYGRGHDVEATIEFKLRSGTKIEAKGRHTSVHVALAKAIDEARSLGAGTPE